jgi:hypothetical protein
MPMIMVCTVRLIIALRVLISIGAGSLNCMESILCSGSISNGCLRQTEPIGYYDDACAVGTPTARKSRVDNINGRIVIFLHLSEVFIC